jgi:hypothetical protein
MLQFLSAQAADEGIDKTLIAIRLRPLDPKYAHHSVGLMWPANIFPYAPSFIKSSTLVPELIQFRQKQNRNYYVSLP